MLPMIIVPFALFILIIILAKIIAKFFLEEPTLKIYEHPFVKPGYRRYLRVCWKKFYLGLTRNKCYRFEYYNCEGSHRFGGKELKIVREFEIPNLDKATDEISLLGANPSANAILDISLARRSSFEGECWLKFNVIDNGIKKSYVLSKSSYDMKFCDGNNCWKINNLNIYCLEPLKKWRILYNGYLRDQISGDVDYVKLSYIWKPYTSVLDHQNMITNTVLAEAYADSIPNQFHKIDRLLDQYEQWGMYYGTYSINKRPEVQLLLWGNKSRFLGKFDWSEIQCYIKIRIYFSDGRVLSFNAAHDKSSTNGHAFVTWGYVDLATGVVHRVKSSNFSLSSVQGLSQLSNIFSINFKTENHSYILNMNTDPTNISDQSWGQTSNVTANFCQANASLVNVTDSFSENGCGCVHFFKRNDLSEEPVWKVDSLSRNLISKAQSVSERKTESTLLKFDDTNCLSDRITGGKGSSLAALKMISGDDFIVPNGFCITIVANKTHIKQTDGLQSTINKLIILCRKNEVKEMQAVCDEIYELFTESSVSNSMKAEIIEMLRNKFGSGYIDEKFAVRSSALGEDGEEISGAGQMKSMLGCKGIKMILESVTECWASCYSFQAVEYRRQNGQPIEVEMGVVVQQMVDADAAGVLFTRDPITGDPGLVTISANYGLGESVVSGSSDPDSITVSRDHLDNLHIKYISLGAKNVRTIMKDCGIVNVDNVDTKLCIAKDTILKLAQIAIKVENAYGDPRDIEWAIKGQQVYLVQARPITSLDMFGDYDLENEFNTAIISENIMLTAGNFREVMPEALSPLSTTFIFQVLSLGINRLRKVLSWKTSCYPVFNRSNVCFKWCRLVDRLEMFYSKNIKDMSRQFIVFQKCMDVAVNGRPIKDDFIKNIGVRRYGYASKFDMLWSILHFVKIYLWNTFVINKMKDELGNWVLDTEKYKNSIELKKFIFNNAENISKSIDMHMMVSMSSMLTNNNILASLIGSNEDLSDENLEDFAMLMAVKFNTDKVESADVPTALKIMSEEIEKCFNGKEFLSMPNKECLQWLLSTENPVSKSFQKFLSKHGHRSSNECDLYFKTWDMDPEQLIVPLKANLKQKYRRNQVKKLTVDEALKKLKTNLTQSKKKSLRKEVIKARENVAYREQAKSLMIRTIHQYRKAMWKLADMMVAEGRLPEASLLMFLTPAEITCLLKTRSSRLIQRAVQRKRLLPKLNKLQIPEISIGLPNLEKEVVIIPEGCFTIEGTPVSQGSVKATARVITSISEAEKIQPGDILVTTSTDIAWSPYFPILSGVVTEIGGLVSHGAVVAREYGLPCIVGAENATILLKSGDLVILDGGLGKISKVL